ncbi:hypothetical protein C1645_805421 [Glomus cerebriforme]|uniref:Uncharacterized protein n=1 Tax=Glomus cerebriforme TaxID=658196 RepID=A0A397T234_9GLOM|nr:hypothetical protein C1645_805421 [Glomus cerebriforme]
MTQTNPIEANKENIANILAGIRVHLYRGIGKEREDKASAPASTSYYQYRAPQFYKTPSGEIKRDREPGSKEVTFVPRAPNVYLSQLNPRAGPTYIKKVTLAEGNKVIKEKFNNNTWWPGSSGSSKKTDSSGSSGSSKKTSSSSSSSSSKKTGSSGSSGSSKKTSSSSSSSSSKKTSGSSGSGKKTGSSNKKGKNV